MHGKSVDIDSDFGQIGGALEMQEKNSNFLKNKYSSETFAIEQRSKENVKIPL